MAGLVPAMCVLGGAKGVRARLILKKVRAQPIGISAAPNMTGQARGEGGKDGRPPYQSATAVFVPLWPALNGGAPVTRQQYFC